ncbi:hypothetical protein CEXT_374461 [Caerostris extrusa]|uniref:Uncharacterized protein n=1 Tax=Caerostris extrusa TaxID=172846 RepID=A0AAV4NCY5_CAEEX|nr:hypothetical protein CEXT_374461 [Caerostris extrusa]
MDIRTLLIYCWTVWIRIWNSPRFQRLLALCCILNLEDLLIAWPDFREYFYSQEFQSFLVSPFFRRLRQLPCFENATFFQTISAWLILRMHNSTDDDYGQRKDDSD